MSLAEAARLAEAGRFDAALRQILACRDQSDPVLALMRDGAEHLRRNNAFAAVHAFEQAQSLDPDYPVLRDCLISALRRDARYQECITLSRSGPRSRQAAYEEALALSALGRAVEALALFDAVLADDPDHAASWFASHGAALDVNGLDDAVQRLERACKCLGANGRYHAFPAAYAWLAGRPEAAALAAERVDPFPARRAVLDGVRALAAWMPNPPRLFGLSAHGLDYALDQADQSGLVLEFGVRRGTSVDRLAAAAGQIVHGFDSFQGLPQDWGAEPAGVLTTGAALPQVADNVVLHAGWFEDVLPAFLAQHAGPVRLVNIDSDIYASARYVLFSLSTRLRPGSIIVFDELIGNRTWADDEFKAFLEFTQAFDVKVEILSVAPYAKQVVMRVLTLRP